MSADDDNNNILPPDEPAAPPPPPADDAPPPPPPPIEEPMEDMDAEELNRGGSSLGGNSRKAMTVGLVLIIGTAVILYYLFSDSPAPPQTNAGAVVPTKPSGELVAQPAAPAPSAIGIPVSPGAPAAPPAPPPPPPPPPPPAPPPVVKAPNAPPPKPQAPLAPPDIKAISPTSAANDAAKVAVDRRSAQRMRSNMLLMSGGKTGPSTEKQKAREAMAQNDPNVAFSENVRNSSETEVEVAGKLTNLNTVIAQGKILNAVLETAINTDLPGTLRAIISRDVYAESGRHVMIPKGSRLIGTYNTGILRGQRRVMIVWTRVLTPDGTDIKIDSPGIDSLGRAGMEGHVDNKYFESFSAALLTSMITVGIAVAADGVGDSTTTNNTDGSTTTSGDAGATAANTAVNAMGTVGNDIIRSALDLRPTITVDQGTRINVFVNKDLAFPGPSNAGSLFVQ